jgi:hypothetical protein
MIVRKRVPTAKKKQRLKGRTQRASVNAELAHISTPPAVIAPSEQAPDLRAVTLPGTPFDKMPATDDPKGRIRIVTPAAETDNEFKARTAMHPAVLNSYTARIFSQHNMCGLDSNACIEQMVMKLHALDKGGTQQIEHHLLSQAVALEAIFTEMARRAALNMGEYLGPTETYMRLALKAQSQCRATLETLAEIKNPRPIFINGKQVNVSNGSQQVNNAEGPQQVNNGQAAALSAPEAPLAITSQSEPPTLATRARENGKSENELLEVER